MNQIQVDIVGTKLTAGTRKSFFGLCIAHLGRPHLGGKEDLGSGDAALRKGLADHFLILIERRGIEVTVTELKRLEDRCFPILESGLICAESDRRDLDAVMKPEVFRLSGRA